MFRKVPGIRATTWLPCVGLMVGVAAACSAGAPARAPTGNSPSVAVIAQPSVAAVLPSVSAGSSIAPLPDGDYVSGPVTKDMAEAILKDPAVADDPGVIQFLKEYVGIYRSTMRLSHGRWTQFVEQGGKDLGVGEEGTYAFPDEHTIVLQSTHLPGTATFGFALQGDKLTWTALKDSLGPADMAMVRVIFESTTWTRKP